MGAMLDYFDLNKRISAPPDTILSTSSYGFAGPTKAAQMIPLWKQITLYLSTVVGILFSPAITALQGGKSGVISVTVSTVIVAFIIAFLLMPAIFEKGVKHDAPFIVHLGLFVQHGVFWSVLLTSVGKTLGG